MKTIFLIFLFSVTTSLIGFCQTNKPNYQSNYNLDFSNFLSGVKYAYVTMTDQEATEITNNPKGGNAQIILGIIEYLENIGFSDVKWGGLSGTPNNLQSLCDLVIVGPSWDFKNSTLSDITLTFVSCNGDIFRFESSKNIIVTAYTDVKSAINKKCLVMYGYNKNYDSFQRQNLPKEITEWTESKIRTYFKENGANPIEGIYESAVGTAQMPKYKLGLIKTVDGYNLIFLSGGINYLDWTEGEIKSQLSATATATLFKANWKMANKKVNDNAYVSFETGLMNLVMSAKDKTVYIKLYPTSNDGVNVTNTSPASGTGFGISSNGLIITNSHVINAATKIHVKGVNGDFSKYYSAKVIIEDKNNDLAVIQINDSSFTTLGTIPFTISTKSSDVGSSVFVLGYPLKAMMGDEIKLTNGIISSKSGFQGDVTSYQISVPIQPGNSGGPLFDSNGNLIGIVNAKLTIGENVSYAIKSSYLTNLIDLLPSAPKLATENLLMGKQLTEQVKLINKFVYIIWNCYFYPDSKLS
jgi:S1-C subfamily serine protease